MISVRSRAHRTLRALGCFSYIEKASPAQINLLTGGEELIGIYRNPPAPESDEVYVTDRRLIVQKPAGGESVPYSQIARIETPQEKYAAEYLRVHLASGTAVHIPVRGGNGRFRDVWEFLRFLQRVSADAQSATKG